MKSRSEWVFEIITICLHAFNAIFIITQRNYPWKQQAEKAKINGSDDKDRDADVTAYLRFKETNRRFWRAGGKAYTCTQEFSPRTSRDDD